MVRDVELLQQDNDVIVLHLINPSDDDGGGSPEPRVLEVPGIREVRVPFHFASPRTWFRAAKAVSQYAKGADLVHSMALSSMIPVALAHLKKPWVHTEHYGMLVNPDITFRQRLSLWIQRQLYRLTEQNIAVSSTLAEVVNKTARTPAVIIENHVMVDDSYGRNSGEEFGAGRELRLLGVGGLIAHKGPLQALEAVRELKSRGHDVTLHWAGDGPLKEEAQRTIQETGLGDSVKLMGALDRDEVQEQLRWANLFLLPTESETFGVAIAEALGHGLPVVTSGTGGHHEFLPQRASRVVRKRDGVALADAVEDLVGDTNRMAGHEIWQFAQGRFSDEMRRGAYLDVYRRAAESHV